MMLSDVGRRPMIRNPDESFGDELDQEIGMLMREKQRLREAGDIEEELNMHRSGSAPPTVEGSLNAVGGLFGSHGGGVNAFSGFDRSLNASQFLSEDDVRSDPAYLSYYYSKVNLNPRLPPPLLSKEDWRSAQRVKGGGSALGGIGDRRKVNRPAENGGGSGTRSLFAMPPVFNSGKKEGEAEQENMRGSTTEWGADGLIGLSGIGLGSRQNSLADMFQNDLGRATPVPSHSSRPSSRNAVASAEAEIAHIRREMTYSDSLRSGGNVQGSSAVSTVDTPASYSYAAVVGGSLSRSTTPDLQMVSRAPSPSIATIRGKNATADKRGMKSQGTFEGVPTVFNESADVLAALSSMSLSANGVLDEEKHISSSSDQHSYLQKSDSRHMHMPSPQSTRGPYSNMSNNNNGGWLDNRHSGASPRNSDGGLSSQYQQVDTHNYQNYGLSGYGMMASQLGNGSLPPLFENAAAASAMALPGYGSDSLNLNRMVNQMNGNALQPPFADPSYLQYLRTAEYAAAAAQLAALNDPSVDRNYYGNSYIDLVQKAYMENLLSPQKSQYGASIGSKSSGSNHQGYYGNPAFGFGLSYPGSPIASPTVPNSPVGMRGHMGAWHLDAGSNVSENMPTSLLDEFKSNKSKCFELSEIVGHVVEFSADQYGSRFIQQKLETATIEDKNMVYQEIFPQSLSLMTDVFGNYVIQKFFEHGLSDQRRELANKLYGHVLTLSLQMYGCRVIQKAIEVVDMDQKIKMVEELEGHVMRCVRDQNGNHVIQKCIECVPEEAIQFIVTTFFDQVVTLSTHPYGCRVIQRVLEHCADDMTQSKVMDEVLGCVSMLAQDQYGNYVIQHVLEHGKPHERSIIIKELAGKIVQMSQQKFASNVVEKCLAFGDPAERQLLVVEILGSTDENEPLQAMMKDQFANYVVQKVLEICEDRQREFILTRIKIHLNALKKYTYGKHIVARVEKLIAAGERRTAIQNSNPA